MVVFFIFPFVTVIFFIFEVCISRPKIIQNQSITNVFSYRFVSFRGEGKHSVLKATGFFIVLYFAFDVDIFVIVEAIRKIEKTKRKTRRKAKR